MTKLASQAILRAPIVTIMLFQVAALLARAYLQTRLIAGGEPKPNAHDLSYLIVPPILMILMLPILRQHGAFLLTLLRRQDLTMRLVVWSVILGITLRLTYWGGLVSLVSFGVLHNSDPAAVVGPVISFACPEPGGLALSLLVVSFLTPIVEEVLNRGLILHTLLHHPKLYAVVLSSTLFAIMHHPQAIFVAFLIGLFLAVQVINCKTLWAALVTHATYNAVSVLDWECISTQWNPIATTSSMIATGLIATVLAIVGITFSIYLVTSTDIGALTRPDVRDF